MIAKNLKKDGKNDLKKNNMKQYTVYYKRLLRNNPLSTTVEASSDEQALELASKKTLIYKKWLTPKKPEQPEYL